MGPSSSRPLTFTEAHDLLDALLDAQREHIKAIHEGRPPNERTQLGARVWTARERLLRALQGRNP